MQGRSDISLGTCAVVFGPTAPAKSALDVMIPAALLLVRVPVRMLEAIIVAVLVWQEADRV